MKSSVKMLFMVTAIAALTCAGSMAQGLPVLKASIPFDFTVGDQKFPAGDYTLTRGAYPVSLQICSNSTDKCIFAQYHVAGGSKPATPNVLVFNSFGDRNFLREVWSEDGLFTAELNRSRAEKGEIVGSVIRKTVAASMR